MTLSSTKYPNTARTVTGTVTLFPSDSILNCDTSLAAVNMTLLDIPAGYFETTWKLYVIDSAGNAGTHNITISVPSGYTINGASTLVINVNGGAACITIVANTKYLAELNYSSGVGGSLAVLSNGTQVVAAASSMNFSSAFSVSAVGNAVSVGVNDSGWLNLEGFDFLAGFSRRPQFRVIGKQVLFRGTIIVPMTASNGGTTLTAMTQSGAGAYYTQTAVPWVLTGGSDQSACLINTDGAIAFHQGFNIFPSPYSDESLYTLDGAYIKSNEIITRNVQSSDGGNVNLTSIVSVGITNLYGGMANVLFMQAYKDQELSPYVNQPSRGLGAGNARRLITKVALNDEVPDYRTMTDNSTTSGAISGATSFTQDYDLLSPATHFAFALDAADESYLGGFQCSIDGLTAFFL